MSCSTNSTAIRSASSGADQHSSCHHRARGSFAGARRVDAVPRKSSSISTPRDPDAHGLSQIQERAVGFCLWAIAQVRRGRPEPSRHERFTPRGVVPASPRMVRRHRRGARSVTRCAFSRAACGAQLRRMAFARALLLTINLPYRLRANASIGRQRLGSNRGPRLRWMPLRRTW